EAQARLAEAERAAREAAREAVARVAAAGHQAELDAWYEQGVGASQRGDWAGAYTAFGEVERLDPGYRDTAARFAEAWGHLARAARTVELPAPEAEPTPISAADGAQAPTLSPNDEPESDWLTPRQRAEAARRRNQDSGDGWLTPRQRAEAARRRNQDSGAGWDSPRHRSGAPRRHCQAPAPQPDPPTAT